MRNWIKYILVFGLIFQSMLLFAQTQEQDFNQDSFNFATDSLVLDSLLSDSIHQQINKSGIRFTLLDSIANDTILNQIFKSYAGIQNPYFERKIVRKNLPTVKEVKTKPPITNQWKFWVGVFILAYIAFVRISNSNNFRVFILSVFNLKLSRKIWEDQRSFFGFVILQLFAIYLFIAALFINNYMEMKSIKFTETYFQQFWIVVMVLFVIYAGKFIVHAFLGMLFKMQNLGVGFVSNTISVNNFVALVIFPFLVFSIYVSNGLLAQVLAQTIIVIFFLSILYRVVRITLLSNSFFSFPTFYLFLYLCALEVAPWFIIVKYLNNYNI